MFCRLDGKIGDVSGFNLSVADLGLYLGFYPDLISVLVIF